MSKKKTAGQKDLLRGFHNNSFGKNNPTNVFTQNELNGLSHKKRSKPKKQTSIRVNSDAASMLMSIETVMRFKNVNEVLYHLIDEQFNHFDHEQKTEYNAFKKVYQQKRK